MNHDSKEVFFPPIAQAGHATRPDVKRPPAMSTSTPVMYRPERLERIDGLHRIPAISPAVASRIYAAAPLTELPASLIPYLISCAERMDARPGDEIVPPDLDGYSHIAVASGEVEVVLPEYPFGDSASFEPVRLLNCAADMAIVILHSIPRGSTVRAVTGARVMRLDSRRVDALRGWMLRCDARRRPARRLKSAIR